MNALDATLQSIEDNVLRLKAERDALRQEVGRLGNQCNDLKQTINNLNIKITNLEETNNIYKLRNTLIQRGDTTELKLKINQLIRDIDKSLELLNIV